MSEPVPLQNIQQLNDDLLKVDKPDDEPSKRNTKEWLMSKILQLATTDWN